MTNEFDFDFSDLFGTPEVKEQPNGNSGHGVIVPRESGPRDSFAGFDGDSSNDVVDITSSWESDPAVIELLTAKEQREKDERDAQAALDEALKNKAEIEKQHSELRRLMEEINRKLNEQNSAIFEARRALRSKEAETKSYDRLIEIEKHRISTANKAIENERSYKERAKGKTWWEGYNAPNGEVYRILEHQWVGAQVLANAGRAILGDGMGLGKTIQAISALDLVDSKRALIITPAEVTSNFANEINQWAPHRQVADIKGLTKEQRNAVLEFVISFEPFVVVVNYEAWRKDLSLIQRLIDLHFDTVILDEAHAIKDLTTITYKGVEKIVNAVNYCPMCQKSIPHAIDHRGNYIRECATCGWAGQSWSHEVGMSYKEKEALVRSVKNAWFMTGTPILNNPADLYPALHLIDPTVFIRKNDFLNDFCQQNVYTSRWEFRSGGLASLTKRLEGRFLARTYEDAGIVLPPQTPIFHEVELIPEEHFDQIRVIEQLNKHASIVLESGRTISALVFIALLTRQRQANVWPGGIQIKDTDPESPTYKQVIFSVSEEITQSAKIERAIEIIKEATEAGQRVALFSQFTQALKEISDRLDAIGISNVEYHGETPQGLREDIKRNWNKAMGEEKKWDVILAHYKSGGVGLNLTEATHTIILDEEWNPGKRDQAYARTRRIGQDESTFVHVLRIPRTVDTWLAGIIEEKADMIEGFSQDTRDMQAMYLQAISTGELSGR